MAGSAGRDYGDWAFHWACLLGDRTILRAYHSLDSIALGIAAGVCCNQFTAIHPALCLVIGIATFLLLLWLQNTSIGFWLVGGLLTLIYAAVFGLLAYFISEHDPIWGWVIFGLVFLVVGALHLRARDN